MSINHYSSTPQAVQQVELANSQRDDFMKSEVNHSALVICILESVNNLQLKQYIDFA